MIKNNLKNIVSLFFIVLTTISLSAQQYFVSSVATKSTTVPDDLTFAVISDTHLGNSKGEGPMVKVPLALKNITSHKPLDAIFVVGDLTDNGSTAQYTQFVDVFANDDNYTHPVGQLVFMLGNHDNYASKDNYTNGLKLFNNNQLYPFDQYLVIKGYPFIVISQRNGSNTDATNETSGTGAYPQAVQDTLASWLARAAAECPDKPIFVFTHIPPKYTCYSSWPGEGDGTSWPTWSMKTLNPILNNYPQAVVFGGHSHYPIGDPRSIHQGVNPNSDKKNFFTGINTGSTTYSEIHKPSVDIGIHPEKYDYVTEGMILTAQSNGDVEIQRWDTYRNEEMHPESRWTLKAPHDGSAFQYADKRDVSDVPFGFTNPVRDGLPAPSFIGTDTPVISEVGINACTVTFPQATDNDYVFRYLIQIKNQSGTTVKEFRKFSQFYLNSQMPDSLSVTFDGLAKSTDYTAEVTAYDSYDNISTPIVSTQFTTLADDDPINQPPTSQGQWLFDDASDLTKAEIGNPLIKGKGTSNPTIPSDNSNIIATAGPNINNGAARIPLNSLLKMEHGSGAIDSYSIMFDIKIPATGRYYALFETNLANNDDADLFINKSGCLGKNGSGFGGYSAAAVSTEVWYRVVYVCKAGTPTVYLNGSLAKQGTSSDNANRINANGLLLFADNSSEDNEMDVAEVRFWNTALTAIQVSNLGEIQ